MTNPELDSRLRCLLRLAVAVVLTNEDELRALRKHSQPNREWRETLLQATLFAGFPRVVAACDILAQEGGLGEPDPFEALPCAEDFSAGRELFKAIYATRASRVHAILVGYHPLLARWIEGHAYGRVLVRDGLSPRTRELLAVVMLAASGLDRQLASHSRGAVRLGASSEEVLAALETIEDLLEAEVFQRARGVVLSFSADD